MRVRVSQKFLGRRVRSSRRSAEALKSHDDDSEGIRSPAGRPEWISSPSPSPLSHAVVFRVARGLSRRVCFAGAPFSPGAMTLVGLHLQPLVPKTNASSIRPQGLFFSPSPADLEQSQRGLRLLRIQRLSSKANQYDASPAFAGGAKQVDAYTKTEDNPFLTTQAGDD